MKLLRAISLMAIFGLLASVSLSEKVLANVADALTTNYNKVVDDCGSSTRPAFLCSGNIIRFTSASKDYHNWDPSSNSISKGGVSFTYIRRDINVNLTFQGKTSGLIYTPSMTKYYWKGRAEVMCSFPTDGWTGSRANGMCGATSEYPDVSRKCQDQGIYTASDWLNHFKQAPSNTTDKNVFQYSCGFDTSIGTANSAKIFNESLSAERQIYKDSEFYNYNEIIIKLWPLNSDKQINSPEQLPIQAFFYTILNGKSGLDDARYYQQDYYYVTGIWIPIVYVDASMSNNIQFFYNTIDQQIKLGCNC